MQGHTRPYKPILNHTRHAKSNEAKHGGGLEKQQNDHTWPQKALFESPLEVLILPK